MSSQAMQRRLIVCADGTWNRVQEAFGNKVNSTNVAKVAAAVEVGEHQILCYLEGVGTKQGEGIGGGAFGYGVSDNMVAAYQFLMENYEQGDQVYLFGFSRGAYTVRSLSAMLHNVGLLHARNSSRQAEAFALYRDHDIAQAGPDSVRARVFRRQYSIDLPIEFLGVWDTVGSLGIPGLHQNVAKWLGYRWGFHEAARRLNPNVVHACHALAIHERRHDFPPTMILPSVDSSRSAIIEQRWFVGGHSDVGGGYADTGLSDIALDWMMEKAEEHGLVFTSEWQKSARRNTPPHGFDMNPLAEIHDEFSSSAFGLLDRLRGYPSGSARKFCPDLHEILDQSVAVRFAAKPEPSQWPSTFHTYLSHLGTAVQRDEA